ncbi:MAG: hypothetical protein KJ914_15970 [Gammaproteobacteria bacterium]|nr:hypothetical protein [Gammaproteobacteria bacterium]MBU1725275.1 hypothetical protein [Gammaproteobacteria bacterium]MBU2006779.1 hypothetical protein [Gammaproteobacteria bacterium]
MKIFPQAFILCAALGLSLPTHAAETVYSELEGSSCQDDQGNDEHLAKGRCKGVGGYMLEWEDGDARQTLNVIDPSGNAFPLDLSTNVSSGFSALGAKAEWRVEMHGKKTVPMALIVRYNVSEDPEKPEKTTSYLVVSKITPDEVCVTDVVEPGSKANEQARELADVAVSKPCKTAGGEEQAQAEGAETPRFLCEAEEVAIFGCKSKDKMISLCASSDVSNTNGYMQYRFGTPDKIELTYPEKREPPAGNFLRSFEGYSGGFSERVRFENGKVQYVVFEDMISNGPASAEKEMHYGVGILMPGKKVSPRLCDGSGSLSDGSGEAKGFVFDHEKMDLGEVLDTEDFNFELELHQ